MADELLKAIHEDVRELKDLTMELVKQGAVMNQTLIEHERRSTNLETRLSPIEGDWQFRSRLLTLFLGGISFAISIVSLYKLLK